MSDGIFGKGSQASNETSEFLARSRERLKKRKRGRNLLNEAKDMGAREGVGFIISELTGARRVDDEGKEIKVRSEEELEAENRVRFTNPTKPQPKFERTDFMEQAQEISAGLTGKETDTLSPDNMAAATKVLTGNKTKETSQLVDNAASLLGNTNSKSVQNTKDTLTEPDKLASLLQRLSDVQTSEKPKELSNADKFSLSVMQLLPAVVGSLFEGEQPGSFQKGLGQTLSSMQREQELAQQQANLETEREIDIAKFGIRQEMAALRKQADANKPLTTWQKAQLKQWGTESKRKERQEERRVRQEKVLSPIQEKDLTNMVTNLNTLDAMGDLDPKTGGAIEGRLKRVMSAFGLSPGKSFTDLKVETRLFFSRYMKSLSGVAVRPDERALLEEAIPKDSDSEQLFLDKLRKFKEISNRIFRDKAELIKLSNPMKAEAVDNIVKFRTSKEKAAKKKSDTKIVIGPDGKRYRVRK
jgi:hypothetical protein